MSEIGANRCQNSDMQKGVEIKWYVRLYLTKSYVIEVILCNSMFNPMLEKSWDSKKLALPPYFNDMNYKFLIFLLQIQYE